MTHKPSFGAVSAPRLRTFNYLGSQPRLLMTGCTPVTCLIGIVADSQRGKVTMR